MYQSYFSRDPETNRVRGGSRRRRSRRRQSRSSRFFGASLETLEPRLVLSTFTVMNTSGDPTLNGSLPFEVAAANQAGDGATINFADAPGQVFATHQTITLASTLTLNHGKLSISIDGPAAGLTIAGGGSGSDFSVITVTSNTQQAAIRGDSPSAPITITDGNLAGSTESGAGIHDFGVLTLVNVAVTNNTSAGSGGGIELSGGPDIFTGNPGAALLASNMTFSGNTAAAAGGALDMEGSAALVVNSTFANNTAAIGGAINNGNMLPFVSIESPLNLGVLNDTLSGNTATSDGGGIDNNHGGVMGILNTIVAGNSGPNPDIDGGPGGATYSFSGHDLIGNASGSANTGISDGANGNVVGHDALLAPLGDYGGADTSGSLLSGTGALETLALLPDSPAIGNGYDFANLTADIGPGDTTIHAGSQLSLPSLNGVTFPFQANTAILVGTEEMLVTGVSGSAQNGYTLTVTRGVNGTSPAAHSNGAQVFFPDERGVYTASNSIGAFQTQGFNVVADLGDSPQSTTLSSPFPDPLGVTVTANDPNAPVDGGTIGFAVPASGASATLSGSTTISGGAAGVNASANAIAGTYSVTASAGFGTSATFSLTNALPQVLPSSSVGALPEVETSTNFTVSWSGSDAGGPGIATYSVYVSDNGGPFTAFQTNTTATTAMFIGVNGHTYGFYSVATDTAGNVQTTPTEAQATTTVSTTPFKLVDDIYVIGQGTVTVAAANGVLENDTGPDQLTVTNGTIGGANGGIFTFNADGSFTYAPPASFAVAGFDYATYTAKDASGDSGSATVYLLSQPAGVIWKFFEQVLHRDPAPSDLEFFIPLLSEYGSGVLAADFFESTELLNQIIMGYYEQYLDRAPTGSDLTFWEAKWRAYGGPELIIAQFASSAEFNTLANNQYGPGPGGWVTALYERILKRDPRPDIDVPFWEQQLAGGTTEGQVALDFVAGQEGFGDDVTGWFNEYLGRAPTSAEQTPYVNQMLGGASDRAIEEAITDLPEYANGPAMPPPGTAELFHLPPYSAPTAAKQTQAGIAGTDAIFGELGVV